MNLDEMKKLAVGTWQAIGSGDLKGAFANLSDDVVWTIPGTLPGISGPKRGKQAIRDFLAGMPAVFPEGLRSEIRHVHADGDTVVVEMTNRAARTAKGRAYENDYCFVFVFAAGRIREIREYVDTQKAKEILVD